MVPGPATERSCLEARMVSACAGWARSHAPVTSNATAVALLVTGAWLLAQPAQADTILASKHDLSVAGPGTIKATTESEVCTFCHTPHRAGQSPLWNHTLSAATYIPYSSS